MITIFLPRGKSYQCQKNRPWLKPGSVVWVQPGTMVDKPYLCIIREREIDWCTPGTMTSQRFTELCTYIPFKHGAVIWEYWADRLTPANIFFTLWMRLFYKVEQLINPR